MALSDDPGLQAALQDSRRQAREATASLRQLAAHLGAERDKFRAESARRIQDLQAQARRGELGPDQERLQRRVDAGETSWRDIASGADDDPSAEAARVHLGTSLSALREELEHDEAFQEADAAAKAQQGRATPEA
ncbi:hypothetical protein [Nocardioides sp. zg-1228]|uniref:hypothetical protein n=1 Tax=Nocardioides sp. zg-1228 TaxID=2763008 RepID=UPI001642C0EE|nr:hypothetical protein [Nocardioides sp. zg-1228]MBC2931992.1 hypothetical protein [Nocardioides sp. zg-1228]QSF57547.1 hypothetical protein JX575_18780 [Nocardioides sp. zg-1228]